MPTEKMREALSAIAEADPVELALDPTWPKRVAAKALAKYVILTNVNGESVLIDLRSAFREALNDPEARAWLDEAITLPNQVGLFRPSDVLKVLVEDDES